MRFNVALLSIVVAFSLGLMWPGRLKMPTITEQQIVAHEAFSNARVVVRNSNVTTEGGSSASEYMLGKSKGASVSLPPLESLLPQENGELGDVQFLFDFAIAGFAKSGTSSLMVWLKDHPEVRMQDQEFEWMQGDPGRAIKTQYDLVSKSPGFTGYKSPHHLQYEYYLNLYRKNIPKTKLIVMIRHPVLWFQSFYNYRVLVDGNQSKALKGPPNELIGDLEARPWQPNSATGAFHRYLAKLGKTDLSADERDLMSGFVAQNELIGKPPVVPNPILLVENRQMSDDNVSRFATLRKDVQNYLGLKQELPITPPHANARNSQVSPSFDICDDQYLPIRSELMHVARNSSIWIREYFLKSPDVEVSSQEYFDELLLSWMDDPCSAEQKKQVRATTEKPGTGQSDEYTAVRVSTKYHNESAAICCIFKDNEAYIDEWIDYHHYVAGFDAFYIYDNSDEFDLEQWARKREEKGGPAVAVKHFPGKGKQTSAYPDCAREFAVNNTWVAFFDADEFLVFRGDFEGSHVLDFLHENFDDDVGQVGFNWYLFGTSGQQVYEPKPVLKRFQFRKEHGNEHVKSIVRRKAYKTEIEKSHPHFQRIIEPYKFVSASGTPMEGPYNLPSQIEKASLNHYVYKSVKEYVQKKVRGRADKEDEEELTYTEALEKYSTDEGNIFDDLAWSLLKRHVPKYALFDGPLAR